MPTVTRSRRKKGSRKKISKSSSGNVSSSNRPSRNKEKTARRQQIDNELLSFIEGNGQNPSLNPSEGQSQEYTGQEAPVATGTQAKTSEKNPRTVGNTTLEDNANIANSGQWPRLQSPITLEQRTQSANTQQTNTNSTVPGSYAGVVSTSKQNSSR